MRGATCNFSHGKDTERTTCFRCGKQGHRVRDCTTPQAEAKASGQVNEIITYGETGPLEDDEQIPATLAFIGRKSVLVKFDTWCMGPQGQMTTALAEELMDEAADVQFINEPAILRYGDGTTKKTIGQLKVNVVLQDEENTDRYASIPVSFQLIEGESKQVIVGWRIISEHRIRTDEDPEAIVIPAGRDTSLRIRKVTVKEWRAEEFLKDARKDVAVGALALIEEEFRDEATIFHFSPTTL